MTTGPLSSRQLANMQRLFATPFAEIYSLYVTKVQRKNRSEAELRTVMSWLTDLDGTQLDQAIASGESLQEFFARVTVHPNVVLITGSVCGVKVQEVEDPLMRNIRYMDKLVDELAQGKDLERILR
ncbi:hypothetical protein M2118_001514 [Aurantimicrobium minutum]|uniref:DUF2200 domain-containing protein n=1 Tax=Aurantimicrobium minutum TaxID=708131 RepID=UPI0024756FB0|nr:DUF2200 family protein [Aurantimicrobium minutum]MDH6278530.1 hypothetical protein [Aurantimicrobium minutum]